MNAVYFKASLGKQYISLAQILLVIGRFVLNVNWALRIEEVAPSPGSDDLEVANSKRVTTYELVHLASPDHQIIEGKLLGYDQHEVCFISILAIDGCEWEIETSSLEIYELLKSTYKDALIAI